MDIINVLTMLILFGTLISYCLIWNTYRLERKDRIQKEKPCMKVKLKPQKECGTFIDVVLCNVGGGLAMNVKFWFDCDEEDFKEHEAMEHQIIEYPIKYMLPNESQNFFLGVGEPSKLFKKEPLMKPFDVVVEYEDILGNLYKEKTTISLLHYEKYGWGSKTPAWRQMEAIEQIKHLLDR